MTVALLNSLSYVVSQIAANRIIQYSPGKKSLAQYELNPTTDGHKIKYRSYVKATQNIRIKTLEKEAKRVWGKLIAM